MKWQTEVHLKTNFRIPRVNIIFNTISPTKLDLFPDYVFFFNFANAFCFSCHSFLQLLGLPHSEQNHVYIFEGSPLQFAVLSICKKCRIVV